MSGGNWSKFENKHSGRIGEFFNPTTSCEHFNPGYTTKEGDKPHGKLYHNQNESEDPIYLVGCNLLDEGPSPLKVGFSFSLASRPPITSICSPNCPRYKPRAANIAAVSE